MQLTVSQSVSQSWCRAPSGTNDQIFITVWQLRSCFLWGALSDERSGLSFIHAAGPCQHSRSWVRVPWDSRPYFSVPDLRLPISLPPKNRRVTVEVFDPASTRVCPVMAAGSHYIASAQTAQKTPLIRVTPLLHITQPLPSNYCFPGSTVLALSKYATLWWRKNSMVSCMFCIDYYSWNRIMVIKLRTLRCAECVAQEKCIHHFSRKTWRKRNSGDRGTNGKIILKQIVKKNIASVWTESSGLRIRSSGRLLRNKTLQNAKAYKNVNFVSFAYCLDALIIILHIILLLVWGCCVTM
jgi:hypothetical protein